jgi:hypothetical protein
MTHYQCGQWLARILAIGSVACFIEGTAALVFAMVAWRSSAAVAAIVAFFCVLVAWYGRRVVTTRLAKLDRIRLERTV